MDRREKDPETLWVFQALEMMFCKLELVNGWVNDRMIKFHEMKMNQSVTKVGGPCGNESKVRRERMGRTGAQKSN